MIGSKKPAEAAQQQQQQPQQSGADAMVHYISKACADILKAAPRRATALKDACKATLGLPQRTHSMHNTAAAAEASKAAEANELTNETKQRSCRTGRAWAR